MKRFDWSKMKLLVVSLFACTALAAYPCPSPNTIQVSDVSILPLKPSDSFQNSITGLQFIQNHWSEIAKMERPTAPTIQESTNCPHLASNLVNWHDPSVWKGQVPSADGSRITLPTGVSVLVSGCSLDPYGTYGVITIPATSELIFGDSEILLKTNGINVQGNLRIGSPTCRLLNKIEITLVGARNNQVLPTDPSIKGILL